MLFRENQLTSGRQALKLPAHTHHYVALGVAAVAGTIMSCDITGSIHLSAVADFMVNAVFAGALWVPLQAKVKRNKAVK